MFAPNYHWRQPLPWRHIAIWKKFHLSQKDKACESCDISAQLHKVHPPRKRFQLQSFHEKFKKVQNVYLFWFLHIFTWKNKNWKKKKNIFPILTFQTGLFSGRKLWSSCLNFMSVTQFQFKSPHPDSRLPCYVFLDAIAVTPKTLSVMRLRRSFMGLDGSWCGFGGC